VRSSTGSHASYWLQRYFNLLKSEEMRQYSTACEQVFYLLVAFVDDLPSVHNVHTPTITNTNGLRPIIQEVATYLLSFLSTLRSIEVCHTLRIIITLYL
jgi:hypothetical protein